MLVFYSVIAAIISSAYCTPIEITEAGSPPTILISRDSSTDSTLSANITSPRDDSRPSFDSFAAIGDSYASGLGAGTSLDRTCRRYDHSYPYYLNGDGRLGQQQEGPRRFEPLACAGATVSDVVEMQVPQLTTRYDLITVTAGGNDVGFGKIVDSCIFNLGTTRCGRRLEAAQTYANNVLPETLDRLLTSLRPKLTPKSGRIYITGYAKFFNADTNQCNFASLAIIGRRTLNNYRRRQYNDMIELVNVKIKEAAERAGPHVTFVDYDPYFGQCGGRICEQDVFEPNSHRARLLFFERGSGDMDVRGDSPWPMIKRAQLTGVDGILRFPDSGLRVFHPRSTGQRIIADAIVAHMKQDKARENGDKSAALEAISCPLRRTWGL